MSDPISSQPSAADRPTVVPLGLRVASTLCWIAGVLTVIASLALGIPSLSSARSVVFLVINLAAGVAVCAAAILIRRRRQLGVLLVALAWAAPTIVTLMNHQTPRGGSFLLFMALLFSAANWKHLE